MKDSGWQMEDGGKMEDRKWYILPISDSLGL
jgi:hypothetical protein